MGRISKLRGNTLERECAKDIREVFGLTDPKDCFRTPQSGGHFAMREAADLTFSARFQKRFPWVVECKNWKKFAVGNFLKPVKEEVSWFQQVVEAAERANVKPEVPGLTYRPVLVAREFQRGVYAAFPAEHITEHVWYTPHVYFTVGAMGQWVAVSWLDFLVMVKEGKL